MTDETNQQSSHRQQGNAHPSNRGWFPTGPQPNETPEAYQQRCLADLRRMEVAATQAGALWRNDPNITGVGYGRRIRGGVLIDEFVVTFFVREKVKTDEEMLILGTRRIPPTLAGGEPTDVYESNPKISADATGQRGSKSYNPLIGGVQTSNADNHLAFWDLYGTICTICFDNTTGAPMALSNWHVWVMGGGDAGDTIIQPSHPTIGDYAEAGAKLWLCGPGLTFLADWNAPSALTAGLAAGAGAALAAAALSDVVDPIRRGQLATPPVSPGEQTLRESVHVVLDTIDNPLPGTPFRVGTKWAYTRTTDKQDYTFAVNEVQTNPHVIIRKQLWTEFDTYKGGQQVRLLAEVETSRAARPEDYHVVAQLVPPSGSTKLSVVLHPAACPEVRPQTCVSFACDQIGSIYGGEYLRGGVTFIAPPNQFNRVVDLFPPGGDGQGELVLYVGHQAALPLVAEVQVEIVPIAGSITVDAYREGALVATATTTVTPMTSQVLTLTNEYDAIDRLVFGGDFTTGLLLSLCYRLSSGIIIKSPTEEGKPISDTGTEEIGVREENSNTFCYTGSITLAPRTEVGCWKGVLYVQTVNNVAPGTDPTEAAQTIGGLPTAQNLQAQSAISEPGCALLMALDHIFHVI
jgi:hypothetical protein